MNAVTEENAAFLPGLRYFSRLLCRILSPQYPGGAYEIAWGPNVSHGLIVVASPPYGAQAAFDKLVSFIRWWRPSVNVRVTAGSSVVVNSSKLFPLNLPEPAAPGYAIEDKVPDPYKPPIYCIPCEDKVFTA